jgi:hypothetical protein
VLRVDAGDADPPDLRVSASPREAPSTSWSRTSLRGPVVSRAATAAAVRTRRLGLCRLASTRGGCGDRLGFIDHAGHELDARGRWHRTAAAGEVFGEIDVQRCHRLLDGNGLRAAQRGEIGGRPTSVGLSTRSGSPAAAAPTDSTIAAWLRYASRLRPRKASGPGTGVGSCRAAMRSSHRYDVRTAMRRAVRCRIHRAAGGLPHRAIWCRVMTAVRQLHHHRAAVRG